MEYDEVFDYIGGLGLYQVMIYIMLGLTNLISAVHNLAANFYGAPQDHWCRVSQLEKFPFNIQKNVAIPVTEEGEYDSCNMYDLYYDNFTDEDILNWNRTLLDPDTPTIPCQGWVFDQSEFVSTINSEYLLVCEDSLFSALTSTLFMIGILIGSLFSGLLSDKFGRMPVLVGSIVAGLGVCLGISFSPNYPTFAVLRLLQGVLNSSLFMCAFVMVMELVGPTYRVPLGITYQIFFSVGFMLVPGISYAIRVWDTFLLVTAIPVIVLLPYIWIVPESPRWLVAKGKTKKAEKILRHAAAVNQRTLPDGIKWTVGGGGDNAKSASSFSDLCKSSVLCKELWIMYFIWFTTSLVYYGLSLNAGSFGDIYLNTFLSGLIEVPANIICAVCLQYGGRRVSNAMSLILAGLFCLLIIPVLLVNPDMTWALTALSTIGKGAITFTFSGIYVYTAELFPTPSRQLAMGTVSVFARIGSMASPFIGPPLEEIWKPLPSVIFGALATLAGALCFLLPETKGTTMPDTTEEAIAIGLGKKPGDVSWQTDPKQSSKEPWAENNEGRYSWIGGPHENEAFDDNEGGYSWIGGPHENEAFDDNDAQANGVHVIKVAGDKGKEHSDLTGSYL